MFGSYLSLFTANQKKKQKNKKTKKKTKKNKQGEHPLSFLIA